MSAAAVTMTAAELARKLHATTCHGMDWNEDCANGLGDHVRVFMPTARRILKADDPAAEIHSEICDYQAHGEFHSNLSIRCIWQTEHLKYIRSEWLGQDDLFGDSA